MEDPDTPLDLIPGGLYILTGPIDFGKPGWQDIMRAAYAGQDDTVLRPIEVDKNVVNTPPLEQDFPTETA